jgi:hypothetical protein
MCTGARAQMRSVPTGRGRCSTSTHSTVASIGRYIVFSQVFELNFQVSEATGTSTHTHKTTQSKRSESSTDLVLPYWFNYIYTDIYGADIY